MQFNYLGGQSQRDTLQNALGQKNATLDAQLDFTKSAFTTGVSGAGQTMRTAMQVGQQAQEAALRNKTSIQEGVLNRQQNQDLLGQRLAAEKTAYERSVADQTKRDADARQARLDDAAAARQNVLDDQAAREARDKEEFERRRALGIDDRKEQRNQAAAKTKGRISGVQARFEALKPQITNPDTLKSVESSLKKLQEALSKTTDPDEQEGLLSSIDDLLRPETLVRMAEGAAKAKEASKPKAPQDNTNPENSDMSEDVWKLFGFGATESPAKPATPAAPSAPAGSIPAATPASSAPAEKEQVGYGVDTSAGLLPQENYKNIAGPLHFQYENELESITNLLKKPAPSGPMMFGSGFNRSKSMFE